MNRKFRKSSKGVLAAIRDAGVCTRCRARWSKDGGVSCEACLKDHRRYKKIAKREGRCTKCLSRHAKKDHVTCNRCIKQATLWREKMVQTYAKVAAKERNQTNTKTSLLEHRKP